MSSHFRASYLPLIWLWTNQSIQLIHSPLIRIEWTTGNGILMSSSQWPIYNKLYPGRTGCTAGYCVARKRAQYRKIRPFKKNLRSQILVLSPYSLPCNKLPGLFLKLIYFAPVCAFTRLQVMPDAGRCRPGLCYPCQQPEI